MSYTEQIISFKVVDNQAAAFIQIGTWTLGLCVQYVCLDEYTHAERIKYM